MSTFMLCTMDSIIKCKDINPNDILSKMCTSLIVGKYTNNGKVYDLDNNTLKVLKHYSKKENLNLEYNEFDTSGYALSRLLPVIIYNYKNEDDLDKLVNVISITNINEEVLLGSYIYYKYVMNLLMGKDKYKALKMEIPKGFNDKTIKKFKNILKGNIYYGEINFDDNIINILSIVFYVIINSDSFNDIFLMLQHIEGNTNIYSSLIFGKSIKPTIGIIDSFNLIRLSSVRYIILTCKHHQYQQLYGRGETRKEMSMKKRRSLPCLPSQGIRTRA